MRICVLAVVVVALVACSSSSEPRGGAAAQSALSGGCVATSFVDASITGAPDSDQAAPDLTVPVDSPVALTGVARQVDIASDCSVTVRKLDAQWRLLYRASGELPADATAMLDITPLEPGPLPGSTWSTSLSDAMHANLSPRPGRYTAQLMVDGQVIVERHLFAGLCGDDWWFNIGPEVDTATCEHGGTCATGQVADVAFDPDNADRIYRGTVGGGVWRSDDFGDHWYPTSDNAGLPAQLDTTRVATLPRQGFEAIGRVFAGIQGEGWSQFIASIFLSTDGGAHWRLPGGCNGDAASALPQGPVTRIVEDPSNPSVIYAATWNGVYVSLDRGECWKNVTGTLLANAQATVLFHTFPIDLTIVNEEGTPALYAAVSPTGNNITVCDVVRKLPNPAQVATRTQADLNGNPPAWTPTATCSNAQRIPSFVSYATFARSRERVGRVMRDVVYTLVPQGPDLLVFESNYTGVARAWSTRTGPTDNGCSRANGGDNTCNGFCNYGTELAFGVDPDDARQVIVGTTYQLMRSSDHGRTWNSFLWRDWSRFNAAPGGWHPDTHVLRYHRRGAGNYLWWGNDGGLDAIRMDIQPAVVSGCPAPEPVWLDCKVPFNCWTNRNNGVATDLFYLDGAGMSPNAKYPDGIGGGLQDNNNRTRIQSGNASPSSWELIDGGGDGGFQVFDALDPDVIYANFYDADLFGGDRGVNRWSAATAAAGPKLGFSHRLWAHPRLSWLLASMDRPASSKGQLYLATDAATTGGAATWRCIDPTPGNMNDRVKKVVFSSLDNSAFVLVRDESNGMTAVYRMTLGAYNAAGDCSMGSAVQNLEVVIAPNAGIGTVQDIARDPASNANLYIGLTPASGQPHDRIMHIVNNGGGYDRISIASSDPRFAPLSNAWVNGIDDNWRLAAPPTSTTLLYVGTENGMFWGSRTGTDDATWTWHQSRSFPTTVVTNVLPSDGANASKGTVRATTYGRSVWELQRCPTPPPLVVKVPVPLPKPAYPYFKPPHIGLPLDYAYDGAAGPEALVTVRPASGEAISPYFLAETVRVPVGAGRIIVGVAYAAAEAPATLDTTDLVVELRSLDGALLSATPLPVGASWRRSNVRSLKLRGSEFSPEGLEPLPVSYVVTQPGQPPRTVSGSEIVGLPQDAVAVVAVPSQIMMREGRPASFRGWLPDGQPAAPGGAAIHTSENVATVAMSSDVLLKPVYLPQPPACEDGATAQSFAGGMVGCAGAVTWPSRASLCASGYHVCSSNEWVANRAGAAPGHNFWTDDNLGYGGAGSGACFASTTGTSCGANQPMRVCAAGADAEGNACNWLHCGLGTASPDQYFGGCVGNTTAGTLCCKTTGPRSACRDGTTEQAFAGNMFGCAGAVTWPNRQSLCELGYHVCSSSEYVARHGSTAPTHNYWTGDDLGYGGSGTGACFASTTGFSCGTDQPMRVCAGGSDAEGNACNWTACGLNTASPSHYFGGCVGNTTAGALCCGD